MGFHDHLHVKHVKMHEITPYLFPYLGCLGAVGIVCTIIGNYQQVQEMYPAYLQTNAGRVYLVSLSFFYSLTYYARIKHYSQACTPTSVSIRLQSITCN